MVGIVKNKKLIIRNYFSHLESKSVNLQQYITLSNLSYYILSYFWKVYDLVNLE